PAPTPARPQADSLPAGLPLAQEPDTPAIARRGIPRGGAVRATPQILIFGLLRGATTVAVTCTVTSTGKLDGPTERATENPMNLNGDAEKSSSPPTLTSGGEAGTAAPRPAATPPTAR